MSLKMLQASIIACLTLALIGPAALAEKGSDPGKGGNSSAAKAAHKHDRGQAEHQDHKKSENGSGSEGRASVKEDRSSSVLKHAQAERKEAQQQAREKRKEAFEKARQTGNHSIRREAQAKFKDTQADIREEFKEDRDTALEAFDEDRDHLGMRRVFVGNERVFDGDFVLIRLTPENRAELERLIQEHRTEPSLLDRLFGRSRPVKVGQIIAADRWEDITLLPVSLNVRYGLPDDEGFRIGILNDQLVLLDTDRRLVLDVLAIDENGTLIVDDLYLPSQRLTIRLDEDDEAYVRAYLQAHPDLLGTDDSLLERFQRTVLIPIGLGGDVEIGTPVPDNVSIEYLPVAVNAQLDLPETDLRLGLFDDDLVLIDTETGVVVDLVPDIV